MLGAVVTGCSFLSFAVSLEAQPETAGRIAPQRRNWRRPKPERPWRRIPQPSSTARPSMANPVEVWKSAKHGFDVWPDIERYATAGTPMKEIDAADLERMKWYGFFYRKRDTPGRYMNRIRITAGELSAPQAKDIAHLAYEFGHGVVDVTTRANLQIQGLEIDHLPRVNGRLEAVGLSSKQTGHDNIRNVFAHPFSGLTAGRARSTRGRCAMRLRRCLSTAANMPTCRGK